MVLPAAKSFADGTLTLDKTANGSLLYGGQEEYSLKASNTGSSEQYNLSFQDVLPVGATYVSGSTKPTGAGEPEVIVITDSVTHAQHQVLIWSNLYDLTPGSQQQITYRVQTDPTVFPIGSQVQNSAGAYTSSDPRVVPDFDTSGNPVTASQITSATDTATATVVALTITKSSSNTPEGELMRGAGSNPSVFSLKVTNNNQGPTTGITVTDYLPAGLEFLGCGGAFNSSGEYTGASTTTTTVANCLSPTKVETVQDPAGKPAGVYTKVTWQVSTLAAGATYTVNYAASIPQRANTMTFAGGTPSADSLAQTANLNNNTGASTRETQTEQTLTNRADVAGTFNSNPVSDSTTHTVTAEDLRIVKTVSPTAFVQGGVATYTLTVDTSEYATVTDMVITDVIPSGMCPLDTTNWTSLSDCAGGASYAPTNATITAVSANADGGFTVTMHPTTTTLGANGHIVITYKALMRQFYKDTPTSPTSSMDAFTNSVHIEGTSTPLASVDAPDTGSTPVADDSQATISSDAPTLTKLRMKNSDSMTCSSNIADYSATFTDEEAYRKGDRACFWLKITFPTGVATRNAQLTDFLPPNMTFESATVQSGSAPVASVTPSPQTYITWNLGSGSPLAVAKGATFNVVLSAIVTSPAPVSTTATALDKENLAKFRYTNSDGQSQALRDAVDLPFGPPPTVGVTKSVKSVGSTVIDGATTPANIDGSTVKGDDQVTFRVDVKNTSVAGSVNDLPISAPDVWDVLPTGITCSAISAISDSGACYDAGDAARPNVAGNATASVIRWKLGSGVTLAAGALRTLTYTMAIPSDVSVSKRFDNTAAVSSYQSATNIVVDGTATSVTHYPQSNINASVATADQDVPAASDTSYVIVPDAGITKTVVTDITATGNTNTQAVIGETLTYTVSVKVPAHTTVYNGQMTDTFPSTLTRVGNATALYSSSGTSPATAALPSGVTVDPATGTLTFPNGAYTNDSSTTRLFEVKIPARVSSTSTIKQGTSISNTGTFKSDTAATGGTAITPRTSTVAISVVEPSPTLAKTRNPTGTVGGGDTVTYTLTAKNASGRPPLNDTVVVDCVPSALAVQSVSPSTGTATYLPNGGTTCTDKTTTEITWTIGAMAGNATATLNYVVKVITAPPAGQTYTNTATLKGSSLADGANGGDPERTYTVAATNNLVVTGATVTKTVDQATRTIGDTAAFQVSIVLPAHVEFYDSIVTDVLPAGWKNVTSGAVTCTPAPCGITATPLTPSADGKTIGWSVGNITASEVARTLVINYTATLADDAANTAGTQETNTAYFKWNYTQKGTTPAVGAALDTNRSATAVVTVAEPGMTIAKAVSASTIEPGKPLTYTITYTDHRTTGTTSAAWGIVVTDTVPKGLVVDTIQNGGTITGKDANGAGGTITWNISGPLAAEQSGVVTYTAHLAPSATLTAQAITNTAAVTDYYSLGTGGRHYTGPTSSASVTPLFPNVTVAKTVASGPAYLGESKSWTVTATNGGTGPAYNVTVTDTLPSNWTYDSGSARTSVAGGAAVAAEPVITTVDGHQVLTWKASSAVPATGTNKTFTVTFTATPGPGAATTPGLGATVNHTNQASVIAEDPTGATGNASGPYNGSPASASTQIHKADLSIVKTSKGAVDGQAAVAGTLQAYTLTVTNRGPDPAVGPITVTDTLPAQLGSINISTTGWTCSLAVTTVTCVFSGSLAANASLTPIVVTGTIAPSVASGTSLTNTATVTGKTADPDPSNNSSSVTDTVTRQADLSIAKQVQGEVVAGQEATYSLAVTNQGASDSLGRITVTDVLPAGTTFVSATGTNWTCAEADATVTCTTAADVTLAAHASLPSITVKIKVPSATTGNLTNTARVQGTTPDPNSANNEASVTTPVVTRADLALTKEAVGDFVAGQPGTYRFTVVNLGPSDAAGPVKITDTLPSGMTYMSSSGSAWDCSSADGVLTCQLPGGLANGATSSFTITVNLASNHVGSVNNTAKVSSPTTDVNPDNNTSSTSSTSGSHPDLAIEKTHSGTAVAGESLTFTLVVQNLGPSDTAVAPTIQDVLPSGMTVTAVSGVGWACTSSPTSVSCTAAGVFAAGRTSAPITITVALAADMGAGSIVNTASVTPVAGELNLANNWASDSVAVVERADLSITKVPEQGSSAVAGTDTAFRVAVTNDGPSVAKAISVSDPLPAGLTFVSAEPASGSGWTCSDSSPVTCTLASLDPGQTRTFLVKARVGSGVPDGTAITNSATVSTTTPESNLDNNSASATIDVAASADLVITKTHPSGDVVAGTPVTFTIGVRNNGPSDAVGKIVVTDTLPVGMTYVSNTGPWDCDAGTPGDGGQSVTCTLSGSAPVLAGTSATALTLTAQVAAGLDPASVEGGVLTNTATVHSPTTDPQPSNNTTTDDVSIAFAADLSVVKHHLGSAHIGDPLTFTLTVSNAGPSAARQVAVTDPLPDGLEYQSAEGDGWTCGIATGTSRTVLCTLDGTIAPGTSAPVISVTTVVRSVAYPAVDNVATVTSTSDIVKNPHSFPDTSSDDVPVPAQVDLSITKTHEADAVKVGGKATFTLTVTNAGPTVDPAAVTVTDPLPAGLSFVSGTGDGWSCAEDKGSVSCVREAGMPIGSSTITLVVDVLPAAYPQVINTASVTSASEDVDLSNNAASDEALLVQPLYHLTISKTLESITRSQAVWRIAVKNTGPNPAPAGAVAVVDNLPDMVTYGSVKADGWTCATPKVGVNGEVECVYGSELATGKTVSVSVTTPIVEGFTGKVTNTGSLADGTAEDKAVGQVPITLGELAETGGGQLTAVMLGALLIGLGVTAVRRRRR